MKIDIVYPPANARTKRAQTLRKALVWPFSIAAYACPVINIAIGGAPWCLIALWSMWIVWSVVLSPNLIEYNRISQISKLLISAAVLLGLISFIYSPKLLLDVIPTVGFAGLVVLGILFFTDIERQKQNMMPMMWVAIASLVALITLIIISPELAGWEWIVLGACGVAIPGACMLVLKHEMIRELKKRFHTK